MPFARPFKCSRPCLRILVVINRALRTLAEESNVKKYRHLRRQLDHFERFESLSRPRKELASARLLQPGDRNDRSAKRLAAFQAEDARCFWLDHQASQTKTSVKFGSQAGTLMLVAAIPKKQAAYLNFLLFGWSRKLTHPACTSIAPWVNHLGLGRPRRGSSHGYVAPDATAKLHVSLTGAWKVLEWLPKMEKWREWADRKSYFGWYLPLAEPRPIPEGSAIHHSVFERIPGANFVPTERSRPSAAGPLSCSRLWSARTARL